MGSFFDSVILWGKKYFPEKKNDFLALVLKLYNR